MMMIMPLVKITSIHVAEPPKQKVREVRTNEPRRGEKAFKVNCEPFAFFHHQLRTS